MTAAPLAQRPQVELAYVTADELHLRAVEVARIGAAAEQEPVQRRDPGALRCQGVAEVGAQKPGAAGDEYFLA